MKLSGEHRDILGLVYYDEKPRCPPAGFYLLAAPFATGALAFSV
jgi:hypothetical protein